MMIRLRVGQSRSRILIPGRGNIFSVLHDVQTDCGSHPPSIHRVSLGPVSDKAAGAVKLITHPV